MGVKTYEELEALMHPVMTALQTQTLKGRIELHTSKRKTDP